MLPSCSAEKPGSGQPGVMEWEGVEWEVKAILLDGRSQMGKMVSVAVQSVWEQYGALPSSGICLGMPHHLCNDPPPPPVSGTAPVLDPAQVS